MAADWAWMTERPEQRAALWSGDWNIGPPCADRHYLERPELPRPHAPRNQSAAERALCRGMDHLIEIRSPHFTHYHKSSNSLYTLDRTFLA
eukprot:7329774-Pyramimonas_sp.AAC.1